MTDTRANGGNQLTGRLYVAAAVSAVAAVLYGYDTGIISGALLQIGRRVRHRQTRGSQIDRREHPVRRGASARSRAAASAGAPRPRAAPS